MDRTSISSSNDVRPQGDIDKSASIDGLLVNPFLGKSHDEMLDMIKIFLAETGLETHASLFHKAAFLSQNPNAFSNPNPDRVGGLTLDRKSTRLNSSHSGESRMPSSA